MTRLMRRSEMREGRTHRVCWKPSRDGFELWLRAHPHVRLTVPRLDDNLDFHLSMLVIESGIDTEPLFTFLPPLPVMGADEQWLRDGLAQVTGNAYAWLAGRVADYYEGGACAACDRPCGPRNNRNFVMNAPPEGDLCFPGGNFMSIILPNICSDRLRSLLTTDEQSSATWRDIDRGPRTRTRYFECIPRLLVPPCAVKGRGSGWRCKTCGHAVIQNTTSGNDLWSFVSRVDLPNPLPPLFAVGLPSQQALVLPMARAEQILAQPGSRGVLATPLGVAEPTHVDPSPELASYHELIGKRQ